MLNIHVGHTPHSHSRDEERESGNLIATFPLLPMPRFFSCNKISVHNVRQTCGAALRVCSVVRMPPIHMACARGSHAAYPRESLQPDSHPAHAPYFFPPISHLLPSEAAFFLVRERFVIFVTTTCPFLPLRTQPQQHSSRDDRRGPIGSHGGRMTVCEKLGVASKLTNCDSDIYGSVICFFPRVFSFLSDNLLQRRILLFSSVLLMVCVNVSVTRQSQLGCCDSGHTSVAEIHSALQTPLSLSLRQQPQRRKGSIYVYICLSARPLVVLSAAPSGRYVGMVA